MSDGNEFSQILKSVNSLRDTVEERLNGKDGLVANVASLEQSVSSLSDKLMIEHGQRVENCKRHEDMIGKVAKEFGEAKETYRDMAGFIRFTKWFWIVGSGVIAITIASWRHIRHAIEYLKG